MSRPSSWPGTIQELIYSGMPPGEIAVLYRAHYHSMELQMELTRRLVPFEVRSGLRFFEQAHIKDIVSYLKVLVNPHDEAAWKRILQLLPGIGAKTSRQDIQPHTGCRGSAVCLYRREDGGTGSERRQALLGRPAADAHRACPDRARGVSCCAYQDSP